MAIKVELPKELVQTALDQAMSLRSRQIKQASNPIISDALEKERAAIMAAKNTLTEIK